MNFFYLLDLIGTFVFAISGTIAAGQKRLDLFGAACIGFVTAIGGGTIRDMMIGIHPVSWTTSMNYFYVILAAIIITFFPVVIFSKGHCALCIKTHTHLDIFCVCGR